MACEKWYNTRMAVIDMIKRFFSSGDSECPIPPRVGKGRMSVCVQEARQIAHEAARKDVGTVFFDTPELDPERKASEVQKAIEPVCGVPSGAKELGRPIPPVPVEQRQRVPPKLQAPVLSFSARLLTYVNEKCGGEAPLAYKRAGVSRQVYSRIVSFDDSSVDKQTAMLFCIGLQLTMSEAELLLRSAGYAFSDTIPSDMLFSYCIKQKIWNLKDVNAIFEKCNLPPVIRARNPYK